MYEDVTTQRKGIAKERKLIIMTSLCVAILLFVTILLVAGYLYYSSFRGFAGAFSQTTSVAYRKGEVLVTTADEEFKLSRENIYYLYNCIINAGRGRLGKAPEREPDVVLEYQFGGRLELWEVKLDSRTAVREYGLFIRFTNADGYEYAYDTDRLELDRLPLTAKENEPGA